MRTAIYIFGALRLRPNGESLLLPCRSAPGRV